LEARMDLPPVVMVNDNLAGGTPHEHYK
jgi:hypothetical protein